MASWSHPSNTSRKPPRDSVGEGEVSHCQCTYAPLYGSVRDVSSYVVTRDLTLRL